MAGLRGRAVRQKPSTLVVVGALVYLGFCAGCAGAETLYDAFKSADDGNPVIGAQRAAVRVAGGDRAISATGYAPGLSASSDYGYEKTKGRAPGEPESASLSHPRGYGVALSQNIWNGFKTRNSIAREDASLQAERDKLRDVEQTILVQAATAYSDVIRDRAIVELRRSDCNVLDAREKQTRFRFQIGDLTRTDVDQSEASLARGQADLTIAMVNLEASQAAYRSVVGRDPGRLEPAAVPVRLIPRDLATAIAVAQAEHPALRAALNAVRAAEINVDVERAGYAPSLDLTASAQNRWDPDFYPAKTDLTSVSVVGRLTIPIYDHGLTSASVSRATDLSGERMLQLDHRRDEIRADVVQNQGLFNASKMVILSADAQIVANDRALYGVELEATAGQRTTLDILTAQRSLLDARVGREIAQHDRIVAGYKLLASIGRLSLNNLVAGDTRGTDTRPAVTLMTRFQPLPEALGRDAAFALRPSFDGDFVQRASR